MVRSRVEVTIEAIDNASPVIAGIGRGLAGGALSMGFDLAAKAAGGFMNAVEKASGAVTDNIMAVGSLGSVMGVSYEKADQLNNKIIKGLAQQASALPGTTDDYVTLYRTISDDVAGMNKEMNKGKFNAKQFETQVISLTSKFAAIGAGSQSPLSETTRGLQALLSGRKVASLDRLMFFSRKNPVLKTNLEKVVKTEGTDLDKMDKGKRLQVILKAVNMTLTDDTITRMNASFDAIKQSFLTKLFDPNVGMFGLLRDVDDNLDNGMQTAFEGITAALDSVIGEKGILMSLAGLLSALGLGGQDPMVTMRNGFLSFAAWMKDVANWLQSLTGIINAGGDGKQVAIANLIKGAMKIPEALGKGIAQLVNSATGALFNLGTWTGAAQIGGLLITAIGRGLVSFIANLSPQSWFAASGAILLMGIAIPALTGFATTLLMGTISAVGGALLGVPVLMIAAGGLALIGIGLLIAQNWQTISTWFATTWPTVTAQIVGFWNGLTGAIGGFCSSAVMFIQTKFTQAVEWASAKVTSFVQGVTTAIGNFFNMIGAKIQQAISNIKLPDIGAAAGAAATGVPGMLAAGAGSVISGAASKIMGGAATGYMPSSGLGGLLGAAIKESRAMPSGSSLMMANSSEAILNRGQQGAMAGAMGGRGGGTFAPNISIQASAGMDVAALADEVMRRIGAAYQTYESGFLT